MQLSELYGWEVEDDEHNVVRQYNEDGSENPSTLIPVDKVVRASIIPRIEGLVRHDVLLDWEKGHKFVKRFGRGFIKQKEDGLKLTEYLQVIITTNYRLYVFSTTGQSLVTDKDFEVYI